MANKAFGYTREQTLEESWQNINQMFEELYWQNEDQIKKMEANDPKKKAEEEIPFSALSDYSGVKINRR